MAKIRKASIAVAALLALIMLAGVLAPSMFDSIINPSSALVTCSPAVPQDKAIERILEWSALSLVAIMVGVTWAIIGQVLSGAFSGQKYNEFVKGMLWGGVETAALLGIFTLLFIPLWGYGLDRLDAAHAYAVLAKNTVSFDFGLMLGANFIAGFITNMNPQFKIPGPAYMTVSLQIAPMFKPILDILGVTMQLITTAVAMWAAQEFLLCFIKTHMLVILLPAGFFLRGFGIKAGGNALIGIALSLFFIYPAMIIMMGETVSSQLEDDIIAGQAVNPGSTPAHVLAPCVGKPICCLKDAKPASLDDPYIPNGNNGATLADRLAPDKIIHGLFNMRYSDSGGSSPDFCMYNTILANVYRATFMDKIMGQEWYTLAGGAAAALGTISLLKYMNVSWMSTALMVPFLMFSIYAIMEMVYFVFIMTIIVPIFILFVTLTLAKEIAKVLGTEIDLSSLEKLI
ncbi:MAG: hypothetical protein NTX79_05330 [Candidatus Micrarchaeota archaeon]|nr:hypothetical protein [Candidatus Micrarchaeota archaeon]